MKPPDYSRSLYFTPRTPWGRRPQKRPGQSPNYLRASEDKPGVLQKTGTWVKDKLNKAFKGGELFGGIEAEKARNEPGSAGVVLGYHKGPGGISTASDEAEKEARNRALNQRQGIYVPADEDSGQESARQGSTNPKTTDQALRTAQQAWAQNHPEWVEQKVQGSMDKLRASQAAQARPQR